ncbi:MAG: acyl-CoA dehydrogenase family protein [Deltaproteobacteria bacterium]|nr:acyl-CoA dehydrogenase family protein [Deltaproteobacteria bacterium]
MGFSLTAEQRMVQKMAREFARGEVLPGAAERDRTGEFPASILAKLGELGFMGMMIPPEYGGAGADTVSYALALSEIAYACASTAVVMSVHNSIVCESVYRFGTEEQKQRYLPSLCAGETLGAFAMTEPLAGSDPVRQETTAESDGGGWVLNGVKRFITSAKHADVFIVTAKTDPTRRHRGISAFVVEKGNPGLRPGRSEEKLGLLASDTGDLYLENCRVGEDALLGGEGGGFALAMQGLDGGRIGISAQSVGVAQAALDAAVSYAKTREQFGRPIGQHQGLAWILADMATRLSAARLMMLAAAAAKDAGENYTIKASMAKLFASEMVNDVCARALQIHGGYGYTKDYPLERYLRDARVFTIYEGTSEIQRVVISRHLLK